MFAGEGGWYKETLKLLDVAENANISYLKYAVFSILTVVEII